MMKSKFVLILIFGIVTSLLFSQGNELSDIEQNSRITLGLGAELHTLLDLFSSDEESNVNLYYTAEFKGYRIEPQISYSKYNILDGDFNYLSSKTDWNLLLGIFKVFSPNSTRFYGGIRIGHGWSSEGMEHWDNFTFAPTIGVEHYFNNNFSFGAESMFNFISSKYEEDDDFSYKHNSNTLTPKLIIRFYL